ncbi:MAG: LD-carboxypeptidase [Parvularculaceae bacterium]|nr:LD-carboxypeptidase [Parvularculaceae bacterium]
MQAKTTRKRIAVVAPANTVKRETAQKIEALVAAHFADRAEVVFHPQCFLSEGHFAGPDAARRAAFIEVAEDPAFAAVWFGRGGYGSGRLGADFYETLGPAARAKIYLGYSDLGFMLARLDRLGIGRPVHGPMASDVNRPGGEAAALRALAFLVDGDERGLEPQARGGAIALNLTVLCHLLGTPFEPDFSGRVLMIEEVSEQHYRIDRALLQATSTPSVRRAAGIMLGRVSDAAPNDPDFGATEEAIVRDWCGRSGVPYLGRADIGHDAENRIVPFRAGRARRIA